jgi:hypothetical protein
LWKLRWALLTGIQTSHSPGIVTTAVGCSLVEDGGKLYPLPVHWRTRYPPDLKDAFDVILGHVPEGNKPGGSSCPIPTREGAYRVLGIGVLLLAFGIPAALHMTPGSDYVTGDRMLLLIQVFSLMGGIGVLLLGAADLARALRSARREQSGA